MPQMLKRLKCAGEMLNGSLRRVEALRVFASGTSRGGRFVPDACLEPVRCQVRQIPLLHLSRQVLYRFCQRAMERLALAEQQPGVDRLAGERVAEGKAI